MKIKSLIVLVLVFFLASCDKTRVYEKNIDLDRYQWKYDDKVSFDFVLDDVNSKKVFLNFRHAELFAYRNVIIKLEIINPKGEKENLDLNIALSEPNGMWFGDCSGDICDLKYPINYTFKDTGKYVFSFEQNMRENPLKHVMSIGLRVENTEK